MAGAGVIQPVAKFALAMQLDAVGPNAAVEQRASPRR